MHSTTFKRRKFLDPGGKAELDKTIGDYGCMHVSMQTAHGVDRVSGSSNSGTDRGVPKEYSDQLGGVVQPGPSGALSHRATAQ